VRFSQTLRELALKEKFRAGTPQFPFDAKNKTLPLVEHSVFQIAVFIHRGSILIIDKTSN
jgi:hypothetical protein